MKRFALAALLAACIGLTLWVSCKESDSKSAAAAADPFEPKAAQPRLPTLKLWLDEKPLLAEIARSGTELQTGMMYRTNLPETEGMLFVFSNPDRQGFWMKNTFVPLSLAYIDPEGVVREIHDLQPHDTNTVFSESHRIQYVLEVNQGWFARHGVQPGAVVRTEKGSLAESFRKP